MTRKEILDAYDVDAQGVIRSPGKFEGEMVYAPYFYDAMLDGGADDDDGVAVFELAPEDHKEFPELAGCTIATLTEDSNGFVYVMVD